MVSQSMSIDEIRYNQESERQKGSSYETIKEIIDHLKEDVINKQVARPD